MCEHKFHSGISLAMLQIYMPLKPLRQTILRTGFFAAFLSLSTAWGPIDLVHEAKAQSQSQNQSQNQGASLPTFDPFESNTDIAGSASLRTISRAVSIEGQDLQDGAILDLAFYYNQIENNSRADRGFEKMEDVHLDIIAASGAGALVMTDLAITDLAITDLDRVALAVGAVVIADLAV